MGDAASRTAHDCAGMFTFTPIRLADFGRLRRWLAAPHVRAWWGDPQRATAEIRTLMGVDWGEAMIVAWQGRSIGYLQACDLEAEAGACGGSEDAIAEPGTIAVDTFIGEPAYVGRGLGPAFLGVYTDRLLVDGRAERIIADPSPANRRSIRCFEKAGFRVVGPVRGSAGEALLMEKRRPAG